MILLDCASICILRHLCGRQCTTFSVSMRMLGTVTNDIQTRWKTCQSELTTQVKRRKPKRFNLELGMASREISAVPLAGLGKRARVILVLGDDCRRSTRSTIACCPSLTRYSATKKKFALTIALGLQCALAQDRQFVVPATYPETAFMELQALRRPEWPMIYQNIPGYSKTLFVPTVTSEDYRVCGWIPVLRNVACFPAAFHWLSNYPYEDRTDYWLKLHSVSFAL